MPFEWFLILLCTVGVGAAIATPLIFRYQDRKHNERMNKIGETK